VSDTAAALGGQTSRATPGRRERLAARIAFFIGGFAGASWAPLVPYAKQRLQLDDGALGLVILAFGLGSISTMALAGWAAGRFGCRNVLRIASILACLALPPLAFIGWIPALVVALFLFGSAIGSIDVVVNIQAVIVEKASGRTLMSGFHAGWSIGGFAGAALVTGLISLGVVPWATALVSVGIILGLHFSFSGGLLTYGSHSAEKQRMTFPHGLVIGLGVLCFIAFLSEGSVLDWGAVFLSSNKNVDIALSGWGYAAFSLVMVICRLTGDAVVHRLGGFRILLFGGLLSATGFTVVILASPLWLMLIGFGLIGLGLSNVVPVLFSLAGKQNAMPAHQAVSVISTIAYSGILLGPAIIGGVARLSNLAYGLGLVSLMTLGIAVSASLARRAHWTSE
jgi:predicted MFS family arabinose efflux permease